MGGRKALIEEWMLVWSKWLDRALRECDILWGVRIDDWGLIAFITESIVLAPFVAERLIAASSSKSASTLAFKARTYLKEPFKKDIEKYISNKNLIMYIVEFVPQTITAIFFMPLFDRLVFRGKLKETFSSELFDNLFWTFALPAAAWLSPFSMTYFYLESTMDIAWYFYAAIPAVLFLIIYWGVCFIMLCPAVVVCLRYPVSGTKTLTKAIYYPTAGFLLLIFGYLIPAIGTDKAKKRVLFIVSIIFAHFFILNMRVSGCQ